MFDSALAGLVTLAVAVSTVLLIVTLAAARRRPGCGDATVHDTCEAAFLIGGPGRAVDTALTALHTDGRLSVGGPGIVVLHGRTAHDTVERALVQEYDAAPHGALHTLRTATMRHPAVQEIGDELAARGLLLAPQETRTWRRWGLIQGVVCLLGLPVAGVYTVYVTLTELDSRLPFTDTVPFFVLVLPALLVGTVLGFVMASFAKRRLTVAGRKALLAYHSDQANLWSPSQQMAVGGIRTLTDAGLRAQLHAAIRTRPHPVPASSQGSTSTPAVLVWCAGTIPGSGPGASCGGSGGCGGGSSCSGGDGGWGGGSSCSSGSSGSSCSSSSSCGGSSSGSSCSSSS
ncbi:TIGR04222 domain-containing membrane protein [Streptomyces sp. NPDC048442]|uniref:TIGR04222 domain-containing membrane protein n=1 Tax=Streptomyces sp. NPDC048442 TaxID=3154823 RepID=UPI003432EE40